MCHCGMIFDNKVEVAAHADKDHKNGYKCGLKDPNEDAPLVPCDKEYNDKGLMYRHVRVMHLNKFNKLCKYPNCDWDVCDEKATRLYHYVQKHDEKHPEITCKGCKRSFSQINKLKEHLAKCGNKIAPYKCTKCIKGFREKYWLSNHY